MTKAKGEYLENTGNSNLYLNNADDFLGDYGSPESLQVYVRSSWTGKLYAPPTEWLASRAAAAQAVGVTPKMKFEDIIHAQKRAKHFGSLPFDGPFSMLRTRCLPFDSNACLLLDAREEQNVEERTLDLRILSKWAESINRYCDSHRVDEDWAARDSFSCFLSRLPPYDYSWLK